MIALYNIFIILIFSFSIIVFILLFFISAPYGKFLRKGWGPVIKSKWAWMVMELPSPALIAFFFIISEKKEIPQIIFVVLWLLHYLHRTFIYPFNQSGREKPYPVLIVLIALIFNYVNGYVNGYGIFHLLSYNNIWLGTWQFVLGILLFAAGFLINKTADEKLRKLRKGSPQEYVIPNGWMFNYISSPHYFGEIIEWAGWAIMTWSVSGLAFFIFTFANLFPRAVCSHNWYKLKFEAYPKDRKAIIPFLI
jgi:3-oxo-5-alpha-steroid 4-dehydrogenase 1